MSDGSRNGRSGRGAGAPAPSENPTRNAILQVAMELVATHGPDGFTVDEVLVASGASVSSLYHHFGNREGLVLAAEAERFRQLAKHEDRRNLEGGHGASTTEEFFAYIEVQLRRIATDPATRDARRSRFQVAARALDAPELAQKTRRSQRLMLAAIAEMFTDVQARGLINPELDVDAYAAWFHGMTLGRTISEDGPIDAEAWLRIAVPAALAPLRLTSPSVPAVDDPDGCGPPAA